MKRIVSISAGIVLLVATLFFTTFQAQSLEKDVLKNVSFADIHVTKLITKHDEILHPNKRQSSAILHTMKQLKLKKKILKPTLGDYTVITLKHGNTYNQIYLYEGGYINIAAEGPLAIYEVTNEDLYDRLIEMIDSL